MRLPTSSPIARRSPSNWWRGQIENDQNGNLIGAVQAKLGLKAVKAIGDIPQNVNYAVKSAYALALLEAYLGANSPGPYDSDQSPSFEDMIAKAQQSVVLILVY